MNTDKPTLIALIIAASMPACAEPDAPLAEISPDTCDILERRTP